jgi:hypothetical protein
MWNRNKSKTAAAPAAVPTPAPQPEPILVVSGLPRSGTSMMMKLLEAGGIPPLTDEIRVADVDNPEGYYEFERVKQLDKGDTGWLPLAEGKAVKIISALLPYLPKDRAYRIIFVRREVSEILASQRKMLVHRGEDPDSMDEAELTAVFDKHLRQLDAWMARQPNMTVMSIRYNDILADPASAVAQINAFAGGGLDVAAMNRVVDPAIYRNRKQGEPAAA